MRKFLETVALAALAVQVWITYRALTGPEHLPARIPIHFDAAGHPNGWGSPGGLMELPAVAVALYVLFTVVCRFPSAFNYPVRVTAQNRAQLQKIALGMIAWLKAEVLCLFAWIQWATIEAARNRGLGMVAVVVPVALVVIFGTIGWHIVAMFRAGK